MCLCACVCVCVCMCGGGSCKGAPCGLQNYSAQAQLGSESAWNLRGRPGFEASDILHLHNLGLIPVIKASHVGHSVFLPIGKLLPDDVGHIVPLPRELGSHFADPLHFLVPLPQQGAQPGDLPLQLGQPHLGHHTCHILSQPGPPPSL